MCQLRFLDEYGEVQFGDNGAVLSREQYEQQLREFTEYINCRRTSTTRFIFAILMQLF